MRVIMAAHRGQKRRAAVGIRRMGVVFFCLFAVVDVVHIFLRAICERANLPVLFVGLFQHVADPLCAGAVRELVSVLQVRELGRHARRGA